MGDTIPQKIFYPDTTSLVLALKDCLNGISTTTASTGVPGVSEYFAGKCTLYLVPTLPLGKPFAFKVHLPEKYSEKPGQPVDAVVVPIPFKESHNANTREVVAG